jgi:hypothetical protein
MNKMNIFIVHCKEITEYNLYCLDSIIKHFPGSTINLFLKCNYDGYLPCNVFISSDYDKDYGILHLMKYGGLLLSLESYFFKRIDDICDKNEDMIILTSDQIYLKSPTTRDLCGFISTDFMMKMRFDNIKGLQKIGHNGLLQNLYAIKDAEDIYNAKNPLNFVYFIMCGVKYIDDDLTILSKTGKKYIVLHEGYFSMIYDYLLSLYMNIDDLEILIYNYASTRKIFENVHSINGGTSQFWIVNFEPRDYPNWETSTNVHLFNIEQMTQQSHYQRVCSIPNHFIIYDYSEYNIQKIKECRPDIVVKHLPYQYMNIQSEYSVKKTVTVGMFSSPRHANITHRIFIEDELCRRGFDHRVFSYDAWYVEKFKKLLGVKILLNIHASDQFRVLEQLRLNEAIFNKIIVVSERCSDEDSYYLKKYVIFCDYENILDKLQDVVENYEEYYKSIYDNFDAELLEIQHYYKKII